MQRLYTLPAIAITAGVQARIPGAANVHANVLYIQSHPSNTGLVFVGDNRVSATEGLFIRPGDTLAFSVLSGDAFKPPMECTNIRLFSQAPAVVHVGYLING